MCFTRASDPLLTHEYSPVPHLDPLCTEMQFPRELKTEILRNVKAENFLARLDFKAVRLVNKEWSACASPFLFDRIHWSPQDQDLEAFDGILRRPHLAVCVKELVFDGSQFTPGISIREYFGHLCDHLSSHYFSSRGAFDLESPLLKETEPDVVELNTRLRRRAPVHWRSEASKIYEEQWEHFQGADFINEGYRQWQLCSKNQNARMNDPEVARLFAEGLSRLDRSKDRAKIGGSGRGKGIRPMLESGDSKMLQVLSNTYHNLTHLSLRMATIELLLDGKWEWIIEFMHHKMLLDQLIIQDYCALLYPGSGFYQDTHYDDGYETEHYGWLIRTVCSYAIRAGTSHPSFFALDEDEEGDEIPRQESGKYAQLCLQELERYLQSTP
ncbi:MAG: hypothetical protein Q9168_000138 [Polycauliona sp. 1 TL-2023]